MTILPPAVPRHEWRHLLRRVVAETQEDRVTLLGAGVAFYGLLSLLPALLAVVSIYGLVADPNQVEHQIQSATAGLPPDARRLLATQLHSLVASGSAGGLGLQSGVSILVALWSASAGIKHLIDAVTIAYEETEGRSYLRLRGVALLFTLGAAVFIVVAAGFLAFLPAILSNTALGTPTRVFVNVIRFPLLAVVMVLGLSLVYRYGPDRSAPRWEWASWGAIAATCLWIVFSAGFALYTSQLGKYNEVYGSLGSIIVLMLWLLITAIAAILGAELNSEIEKLEGSPADAPAPAVRQA